MSEKKKYQCQAFIEDVYSTLIEVEADNEDEALKMAREEAENLAQGGSQSLDLMDFQESQVQDVILVGERDVKDAASVRYDIDRAVERVQQCIRGETDTKDSLTEFELREEADNLCLLLSEYFEMEEDQ